MGCGDSSTNGEIQLNAPFQWANLPTADTSLYETLDYVVAKLNGKDAIWAGDPALHTQKRIVHRGERDVGAALAGLRPADGVAHQEAHGRPRQHGVAHRRSPTRST